MHELCGRVPTFLHQNDTDRLSALQHRPAAIEPAFGQIALPHADVEAALTDPWPDLGVSLDLQHVLPAVGAREVRRALPSLEGGVGLPGFLVIRPLKWGAIFVHALMKGFERRMVPVVVVGELDANPSQADPATGTQSRRPGGSRRGH